MFIKQPDGKWAIFSTFSDTFEAFDLTEQELIDHAREHGANMAEASARAQIRMIHEGYSHVTQKSLEQACELHLAHQKNCSEDPEFMVGCSQFCERILQSKS